MSRSSKILSMMEEVYSRIWYMEKEKRSRKYKGSYKGIQGKNKYWSKMARKVGYDRGKEL